MNAIARRAGCALLLALAGCAREPPIEIGAGGSPAEARRQLARAAASGPVAIRVVRVLDRPSEAEVAALAARGVSSLAVRFQPTAEPGSARLVMALDGLTEPERICAREPLEAAAAGGPLLAAWCEGSTVVARVRASGSTDPVQRERLVWRAAARLFPDDYADTWGWNLFGLRVTVGGSFGF